MRQLSQVTVQGVDSGHLALTVTCVKQINIAPGKPELKEVNRAQGRLHHSSTHKIKAKIPLWDNFSYIYKQFKKKTCLKEPSV